MIKQYHLFSFLSTIWVDTSSHASSPHPGTSTFALYCSHMKKLNFLGERRSGQIQERTPLSSEARLEGRIAQTKTLTAQHLERLLQGQPSQKDLVERYTQMTFETPRDERLSASETLRLYADRARFADKPVPEEIALLWNAKREQATYAEHTQKLIRGTVDPTDPEQMAFWLKDPHIQPYLMADMVPAHQVESVLCHLTPVLNRFERIAPLCNKLRPPKDREIFRALLTRAREEGEGKPLAELMVERYPLAMYIRDTFSKLYRQKEYDAIAQFVSEDLMPIKGIMDFAIADFSPDFLFSLVTHVRSFEEAQRILKYIHDPLLLTQASHPSAYPNLPTDAAKLAEIANRLEKAREASPVIRVLSPLIVSNEAFDNKFILSIGDTNTHWTIAWANTETHSYHKDQLRALGKGFSGPLTCGGHVRCTEDAGQVDVQFCSQSGDFGAYPDKLLATFKDAIQTHLAQQFPGKTILITFKPSSQH